MFSTRTGLRWASTWQMKHKPQTPAKWTKILPWRKRLEEKAKPKVAVLNLHGMIANSSLNRRNLSIHSTQKLIDKAFDTKKCEMLRIEKKFYYFDEIPKYCNIYVIKKL